MSFILFILFLICLACLHSNTQTIEELNKKIEKLENKLQALSNKMLGIKNQTNENSEKIAYYEKEIISQEPLVQAQLKEETYAESTPQAAQNDKIKQVLSELDIENRINEIKSEKIITTPSTNHTQDKDSTEKMLMGNVFNKIGAIILTIALIIFIKLTGFEFTPVMKIALSYLASIGLTLFSINLYNKTPKNDMKQFAQVLWGLGLSISFVATYSACGFYKIMPTALALIIGIVLTIVTYFISEKYKSISAIFIGAFGGYLNLAFSHEGINAPFMFSYLIAINLIGIVFAFKNNERLLICICNLLFSAISIAIFAQSEQITLIMPIALWLIYFISELIYSLNNEINEKSISLNWVNLAVLVFLANAVYGFENLIPAGCTLLFCSIIYFVLFFILKGQNKNLYLYNAIASIIGATFFLLEDFGRICAFSIEMLIISCIANKSKIENLQKFPLILCVFIFTNIIKYYSQGNVESLLWGYKLMLLPSLCIFLSSLALKKKNKNYSGLLAFFSISLLFIYSIFELNQYLQDSASVSILTKSILGFVYSISVARLSKTHEKPFFVSISIFIYAISYIALLIGALAHNFSSYDNFMPIVNLKFLTYMISIGALWYLNKYIKLQYFGYFCLFTSTLAIASETYHIVDLLNYDKNAGIIISIVLSIYAFILMILGISRNYNQTKKYGISLLLLMFAKIILIDLIDSEAIEKLIAFIVLGLIMLIVSYYYTKKTGD